MRSVALSAEQVPPMHLAPSPQTFPHVPQFALSVCVLAQYAGPPSGVHSVSTPPSDAAHAFAHAPFWQILPLPQVTPQAPQLALSVFVFAQYGAPASGVQSVSVPASSPPHELVQLPSLQTCPAPHVVPQP